MNTLYSRLTVHPADERIYTGNDCERLRSLLVECNDAITDLGLEYEMDLFQLCGSVPDYTQPMRRTTNYLIQAARMRIELLWALRRLQIERRLEGDLYKSGFAQSQTKILTLQHIHWLYNQTMSKRQNAMDIGLPVRDICMQIQ